MAFLSGATQRPGHPFIHAPGWSQGSPIQCEGVLCLCHADASKRHENSEGTEEGGGGCMHLGLLCHLDYARGWSIIMAIGGSSLLHTHHHQQSSA